MPDNKQKCKSCKQRHLPPTGKRCQFVQVTATTTATATENEHLRDAAVSSGETVSQMTPGGATDGQLLQVQILEQLQRVTERLEQVEKMAASTAHSTPVHELSSTDNFLNSLKPSKKVSGKYSVKVDSSSDESVKLGKKVSKKHKVTVDSFSDESVKSSRKVSRKHNVSIDSSSDESDAPSLGVLRSKKLQKQVDKRIRELNQCSHLSGKDSQALKSKRGGGVLMLL